MQMECLPMTVTGMAGVLIYKCNTKLNKVMRRKCIWKFPQENDPRGISV